MSSFENVNLVSNNNYRLLNQMLDKLIDERFKRASLSNSRQDSNSYLDVDKNYNAQKQYTAQRMGRIVGEQNKYPDHEQEQSAIFRNTFFNTPIPEAMQLSQSDKDYIIHGTKKEQSHSLENVIKKGGVVDNNMINKNELKKMILRKLNEPTGGNYNDSFQENNMLIGGKQKKEKKEKKEKKKRAYYGNPWVEHVKSEAKKLGIKYGHAITDPRIKESYLK